MKEEKGNFDTEEFLTRGLNKQVGLLRALDTKIVNSHFGVKAKLKIHQIIQKAIGRWEKSFYKEYPEDRNNFEKFCRSVMNSFLWLEDEKMDLKRFLDLKGIGRVRGKINEAISLINKIQKEFFIFLTFYKTEKESWIMEAELEHAEDDYQEKYKLNLDFARKIFFGKNFKPRPKINGHYLRRFEDSALLVSVPMTVTKGNRKGVSPIKQKGKVVRKLGLVKT